MSQNHYVSSTDLWWLNFNKSILKKFETLENTLSIVIQGPLNDRSLKTIPSYLKYGEVIVSCWGNDNLSKLDSYKKDIKIVINNCEYIKSKSVRTNQKNPIILQNYTTLNGLKKASGHFTIKTRSDESYPVLDPLIDMLRKNRDTKDAKTGVYNWHKIITSNIYFRHDKECKFHPSDHLIAGQTKRMKEIFKESYRRCTTNEVSLNPEVLIGKSVIESYFDPILKKWDKAESHRSVELMQKHFEIIRVSNLPKSIWTSSYRKYDPLKGEEDWCHHINDIKKYT